jgi:polyphosphate kinase 2 (PPK2 family)
MNLQKHDSFGSTGSDKKRAKDAKPEKREKLSSKEYEKELHKLQVELSYLQDWVRETGARVIIVCEGRDTAGKGGLIKRLTERVSPRTFPHDDES